MTPEAEEWEKWADEKFNVLLYPNMTRNFGECWQALASPARGRALSTVFFVLVLSADLLRPSCVFNTRQPEQRTR